MSVASQIRQAISGFPAGYIFTLSDFSVAPENELAVAKLLSRMAASGDLQKVSKGKYYKPKQTTFGLLKPPSAELVKDFLEKDGRIIGYLTGNTVFSEMGLSSQITSTLLIGSNKYRNPLQRGDYKVSFLYQANKITEDRIPLLRILDAIKLIRNIPGTAPSDACKTIMGLIGNLTGQQAEELESLALAYTSYVRALTGAMLEYLGLPCGKLRASLNGTSRYQLPVSQAILPTTKQWRIYEPAR